MADARAARRYAKALHGLASAEGRSEAVRSGLGAIANTFAASPDLRAFVANYTIPAPRRQTALEALFKTGSDPLLYRFLLFLDEKKRLPLIALIAAAYERLTDEERGVLRIQITSPGPLGPDQVRTIAERFRVRLNRREVVATCAEDARLLGGFTVQIGDQVMDYSLETQLQLLKQKLSFA